LPKGGDGDAANSNANGQISTPLSRGSTKSGGSYFDADLKNVTSFPMAGISLTILITQRKHDNFESK
jgi:hypothetical protein